MRVMADRSTHESGARDGASGDLSRPPSGKHSRRATSEAVATSTAAKAQGTSGEA